MRKSKAMKEVKLEAYDTTWVQKFESIKSRLEELLGKDSLKIEHVGSTSVPGLSAKPIIDVIVGVKDMKKAHKQYKSILEKNGYQYFDTGSEDTHRFYRSGGRGFGICNLKLIEFQSTYWKERIRFRNRLRSNESLRKRYNALKKKLAKQYPDDRDAYTEGKAIFIQENT